jgi:hypothetical protein
MESASSFSALKLERSSLVHGGLLPILIAVNPFIVCAYSYLQKSSDLVKLVYIFEEKVSVSFKSKFFGCAPHYRF